MSQAITEPNLCTGNDDGSFVRNVKNASEYFQCISGIPIRMQCASSKMRFNYIVGRCQDEETVKEFECPLNRLFADVAVPNNCHQFIRCYNGNAEQLQCAEGLLFDVSYGMCNLEILVQCPFTMECPNNNDDFIVKRDPYDCKT